jgi:hypothetical protein
LKFKPHTYNTNQTCNYTVRYCIYYSDTRGVIAFPPNRNLDLGFRRSSSSNRNSEQSHISSLWQCEVQMARTKKVLAFSSCFFFSVVPPLYLEKIDCFTPRDTILVIQDLDWMLGVRHAWVPSSISSIMTIGRCRGL